MFIYYIPIIAIFVVIFIVLRKNKFIIAKKIISKRNTEETRNMIALAKRFVEKDCIVYSFDGHQFEGVVKEVSNSAILIEKNGEAEAINLDFVIRIREYPRNKNGKKKSVVLD